jgi:3-hydroxybutyryl-CoA dehydrogenase
MVLVVGGGTMGAGIAEVLLRAGKRVVLCETDGLAASAARDRVVAGLERRAAQAGEAAQAAPAAPAGQATAEAAPPDIAAMLEVVVGIPNSRDVKLGDSEVSAELAIEAVFEDVDLKRSVLREIESRIPDGALLASNTSSLSIGDLAAALRRPERFLGMHFFNPVPRSLLVEIVTGPATTPRTVERARDWVRVLGKQEIVVRDSPGFATSRLGVAIGLEAIRILEEGVASAAVIDRGKVRG